MRSRWEILWTVLVGLTAAVVGFLFLQLYVHLRQDEQTLHQMIGLVNYNLSVGKLEAAPVGSTPPPPVAAPPAPTPSQPPGK